MNTSKHSLESGLAALPAVMVMLVMAGCAGTHVGDDWQCPLAQGEVCASVSAADPAVPAGVERADSPLPAGEISLYRPRGQNDSYLARKDENASTEAGNKCGRGFGLLLPFAWLGSLFTPESHASVVPASSAGPGLEVVIASPSDAEPLNPLVPRSDSGQAGESDTTSTEVVTRVPTGQSNDNDDAREPERIGRVWIGPFVDADGVYREASWVRIVIAPAEWRIP